MHWPRAMQQLNSGAIFLANLTEGRSDAPDSFSKAPRLKLVLCLVCVLFGLSCFRDADGSGLWSTRPLSASEAATASEWWWSVASAARLERSVTYLAAAQKRQRQRGSDGLEMVLVGSIRGEAGWELTDVTRTSRSKTGLAEVPFLSFSMALFCVHVRTLPILCVI